MAIRVRKRARGWVALCAAATSPEPGDIYLDDGVDAALRKKLLADYRSEGLLLEEDES